MTHIEVIAAAAFKAQVARKAAAREALGTDTYSQQVQARENARHDALRAARLARKGA